MVHVILEGWAAKFRLLPDGRRQITAIYLKGDLCDPAWFTPAPILQPVIAMTGLRTGGVSTTDLRDRAEQDAHVRNLIWDEFRAALDAQAEWAVNLGRKTARERVAYLLCEIVSRSVGYAPERPIRCEMPLTQSEIADLTGITSVHVNRKLQDLRSEGLIVLEGHRLSVPDIARLARLAYFTDNASSAQRARLSDLIILKEKGLPVALSNSRRVARKTASFNH